MPSGMVEESLTVAACTDLEVCDRCFNAHPTLTASHDRFLSDLSNIKVTIDSFAHQLYASHKLLWIGMGRDERDSIRRIAACDATKRTVASNCSLRVIVL